MFFSSPSNSNSSAKWTGEESADAPDAASSDQEAQGQEPSAPETDEAFEEECAFIRQLVSGVKEHSRELDERIAPYLRGWTLERTARVDLAILRLSFYEMLYLRDTPESIVINEAVEMAKRYSTDKSGAFVNGVLGALSRGESV